LSTTLAPWRPAKEPHFPPWYDEDIVYATRAVASGTASEGQQKLFFRYLMFVTGSTDEFSDLSYRPGGEEAARATAFAEGKRFVGNMLRKLFRVEFTPHARTEPKLTVQQQRLTRRRAA
jgi:hypothetical protein